MNRLPIILCYHRIAYETKKDLNRLTVTPKLFCEQLSFLAKSYKFVTLEELIEVSSPNTLALTFDDGYHDNYAIAANILSDRNIPASFFIATRFVQESIGFYPSSLNSVWNFYVNTKKVPTELRDTRVEALLTSERSFTHALRKLSEFSLPELWDSAVRLSNSQQQLEVVDPLEQPLKELEILEIARSNLFSIGPHTATHPRMSSLPFADALSDFAESVIVTQNWTGQAPQYFPYPFGQLSDFSPQLEIEIQRTFQLKGLSTLPTAIGRRQVHKRTLPRLSMRSWTANELSKVLTLTTAFSYVPILSNLALSVSRRLRKD